MQFLYSNSTCILFQPRGKNNKINKMVQNSRFKKKKLVLLTLVGLYFYKLTSKISGGLKSYLRWFLAAFSNRILEKPTYSVVELLGLTVYSFSTTNKVWLLTAPYSSIGAYKPLIQICLN